jgi:predicted nucleotidyltransferase
MSASNGHLGPTLERMEYGRALKGAILMQGKPGDWTPYAQPLLDAVRLFEELGIGYALVGGIAAMYYGRSRFTEDVDFVAASGHMDVFAAHATEMEKHHFDPSCTYKLYHQSGVQVDLWKDDHADQIVRDAHAVELAGRTIQMVDVHDLIAMKLRSRRLKDDYDISQILQMNSIDEDRLKLIVTPEEFSRLREIKGRK